MQTFTQANKTVLYLSDNGVLLFPNGESPVTVGAFRAYFRLTNLMGGDGRIYNANGKLVKQKNSKPVE